jgi:uncharacterized RDD family membrane protein YckC
MNTQNENKTIQDLKQDLLEAKIDALTTMTRAAIILLMITLTLVLTIFLGSASFQTRTDKRTETIIEKLDSNLSK